MLKRNSVEDDEFGSGDIIDSYSGDSSIVTTPLSSNSFPTHDFSIEISTPSTSWLSDNPDHSETGSLVRTSLVYPGASTSVDTSSTTVYNSIKPSKAESPGVTTTTSVSYTTNEYSTNVRNNHTSQYQSTAPQSTPENQSNFTTISVPSHTINVTEIIDISTQSDSLVRTSLMYPGASTSVDISSTTVYDSIQPSKSVEITPSVITVSPTISTSTGESPAVTTTTSVSYTTNEYSTNVRNNHTSQYQSTAPQSTPENQNNFTTISVLSHTINATENIDISTQNTSEVFTDVTVSRNFSRF
ncbi:hypothetical protein GQR58_017576 [Nymphon striatum]|nr:hypothetical protein GQR58_017576 [Nymphon striatum]